VTANQLASGRKRGAPADLSLMGAAPHSILFYILEKSRMTLKTETAKCPDCGALLVLVGLRHLCRPGHGRPRLTLAALQSVRGR
jgi:hypothetical protein